MQVSRLYQRSLKLPVAWHKNEFSAPYPYQLSRV